MPSALRDRYAGLVCDLDGVVYLGSQAVPYAVEELTAAGGGPAAGVVYATNNASRTPSDVAAQLCHLGLQTEADQVINSSMAGAAVIADRFPPGAGVLAVGGAGVAAALQNAGLTPVQPSAAARWQGEIVAALQGYGPQVCAADLAEVAFAVQAGAAWIVTNDDRTLPTERGVAPGNGSLVGAVRMAVDLDPEVVGKPGPLMYEMAARLLGVSAGQTLAVGDRLETDIAGAHAAGMDALLVLTGVHGPVDLVRCEPGLRPRYVASDLRSLSKPYEEPQRTQGGWQIGEVTAILEVTDDECTVRCDRADAPQTPHDVTLRLALRAIWEGLDEGRLTQDAAVRAITAWQ
ncbi:MAG: HAD-IIA family hydrolase [Allobranchiibius sp.]